MKIKSNKNRIKWNWNKMDFVKIEFESNRI